jgi:hypothetical protein
VLPTTSPGRGCIRPPANPPREKFERRHFVDADGSITDRADGNGDVRRSAQRVAVKPYRCRAAARCEAKFFGNDGRREAAACRYEGEPNLVEGYPPSAPAARRSVDAPGVSAASTTDASIDDRGQRALCDAARLGRAAWIRRLRPRCFLWQNAPTYEVAVTQHRARHLNSLGMAKMLYDARRRCACVAPEC